MMPLTIRYLLKALRAERGEIQSAQGYEVWFGEIVSWESIESSIDAYVSNPFCIERLTTSPAHTLFRALAEQEDPIALILQCHKSEYEKEFAAKIVVGLYLWCWESRLDIDIVKTQDWPIFEPNINSACKHRLKVHEQLGIRVQYLLSVVSAAARCYHALLFIKGTSPQICAVRANAWDACFGTNLFHAITRNYEVLRRRHVLIVGERGTGKRMVARAIQAGTFRSSKSLLRSEESFRVEDFEPKSFAITASDLIVGSESALLYGVSAGYFTDVSKDHFGFIRIADSGSLFIDEFADLTSGAQVALLRAIDEQLVWPVGGDEIQEGEKEHHYEPISVDVRYIAASKEDILCRDESGPIRLDLFDRIAKRVIRIPPLRERLEDIADIVHMVIWEHGEIMEEEMDSIILPDGNKVYSLYVAPPYAQRLLSILDPHKVAKRSWDGNVRELLDELFLLVASSNIDPFVPGPGGYDIRGMARTGRVRVQSWISPPFANDKLIEYWRFFQGENVSEVGVEGTSSIERLESEGSDVSRLCLLDGLLRFEWTLEHVSAWYAVQAYEHHSRIGAFKNRKEFCKAILRISDNTLRKYQRLYEEMLRAGVIKGSLPTSRDAD